MLFIPPSLPIMATTLEQGINQLTGEYPDELITSIKSDLTNLKQKIK